MELYISFINTLVKSKDDQLFLLQYNLYTFNILDMDYSILQQESYYDLITNQDYQFFINWIYQFSPNRLKVITVKSYIHLFSAKVLRQYMKVGSLIDYIQNFLSLYKRSTNKSALPLNILFEQIQKSLYEDDFKKNIHYKLLFIRFNYLGKAFEPDFIEQIDQLAYYLCRVNQNEIEKVVDLLINFKFVSVSKKYYKANFTLFKSWLQIIEYSASQPKLLDLLSITNLGIIEFFYKNLNKKVSSYCICGNIYTKEYFHSMLLGLLIIAYTKVHKDDLEQSLSDKSLKQVLKMAQEGDLYFLKLLKKAQAWGFNIILSKNKDSIDSNLVPDIFKIALETKTIDSFVHALIALPKETLAQVCENIVNINQDLDIKLDDKDWEQNGYALELEQVKPYMEDIINMMIGNMPLAISDDGCAKTDGNTIYLPQKISYFVDSIKDLQSNRNLVYFRGLAVHECCHILANSFSINLKFLQSEENAQEKMSLINLLEDVRVERFFYHYFSNKFPYFQDCLDFINIEFIKRNYNESKQADQNELNEILRLLSIQLLTGLFPHEIDSKLKVASLWTPLKNNIRLAVYINQLSKSINNILDIDDASTTIKAYHYLQKELQKHYTLKDMKILNKECFVYTNIDESLACKNYKESSFFSDIKVKVKNIAASSKSNHQELDDDDFYCTNQQIDIEKEISKLELSPIRNSAFDGLSIIKLNTIVESSLEFMKQYQFIEDSLTNQLKKIVSDAYSIDTRPSDDGLFSTELFIEYLATKDPNICVFEEDFERREKIRDFTVLIGLDASGSTDYGNPTILEIEKTFAYLLAKSLKNINIEVEVLAYNSWITTDIYQFENLECLSSLESSKANRDGDFILYAMHQLLKKPIKDKYLFYITDGMPCGINYEGDLAIADTIKCLREAKSQGIQIIYFNIAEQESDDTWYELIQQEVDASGKFFKAQDLIYQIEGILSSLFNKQKGR